MANVQQVDALIVGAGFSGMYALHRLRNLGLSAQVLERADDVGGTWYWNRYPGARCDVESMQYSYSFDKSLQNEWHWPEKFSAQPDILRYAKHVAERFDLKRDIQFGCTVRSASYDEEGAHWVVETSDNDRWTCTFLIMATGCISTAQIPDIPGLDHYAGNTYHTGDWPHHTVDFKGQKVGVIGTGSSGIQAIPVIAKQARSLTVFQRTANYSLPARNFPMSPAYETEWKDDYPARRMEMRYTSQGALKDLNDEPALEVSAARRAEVYEARWASGGSTLLGAFNNLLTDSAANETAAEFVRSKIRTIVKDKQTAALLCPDDHPIGTKRICIDSGYYETFNCEHVELVDIKNEPISRFTQSGLVVGDRSFEFDSVVFATGFDAMTGTLFRIDLRGRLGEPLKDKWSAGPVTYLGLMTADFPNLFLITGPGSPSVKGNMLNSLEQHVDLVTETIAHMRRNNFKTLEPTTFAETEWGKTVQEVAHKTLFPQANSWYMGANIPGKPRLFMPYIGGVGTYRRICEDVVANGYRGFVFDRSQ